MKHEYTFKNSSHHIKQSKEKQVQSSGAVKKAILTTDSNSKLEVPQDHPPSDTSRKLRIYKTILSFSNLLKELIELTESIYTCG